MFHLPNWDHKDRIVELAARVPCDNPHWSMLFHRWFLNMVAHWRGFDTNSTLIVHLHYCMVRKVRINLLFAGI